MLEFIKSSFKRKKFYWLLVIGVFILCFGFLLTNQSIGIDDENFKFYFDNYGIVASGRYGYILLMKILNSYEYLPVWRDVIALIVLLIGVVITSGLFKYLSNDKISEIAITVFSCIVVSYPLLAKMFAYISINIEVALILLLAGFALFCTFRWFVDKKIRYPIFSIMFLTFGISMIENCLNYYVTGAIIGLLLIYIYGNEEFEFAKGNEKCKIINLIKSLTFFAVISGVSIVANSILSRLSAFYLKIPMGRYSNKFLVWDLSNISSQISAFFHNLWNVFKGYYTSTFYFKIYILAIFIFFIIGVLYTIKRKSVIPILLVVACIASTFAFYLITGNVNMVTRTFVVYSVFAGSSFAMLYEMVNVKYLKILVLLSVVVIVFYQTKEVNKAFNEDYKRFIKDSNMAADINREIEKQYEGIPSLPVVFLGSPLPYSEIDNRMDEVFLRSMFSDNEDGNSLHIHAFFDMLGYHYRNPLDKEFTYDDVGKLSESPVVRAAKKDADDMPIWPQEGSVKVTDTAIIVKLGDFEDKSYKMDESLFEKVIDVDNGLTAKGQVEICRIDNLSDNKQKLYISGHAAFEKLSSAGTHIYVVLSNKHEHYVIGTEQYRKTDVVYQEMENINGFRIYKDLPDLSKGNWTVRILLKNGQNTSLIESGNADIMLQIN